MENLEKRILSIIDSNSNIVQLLSKLRKDDASVSERDVRQAVWCLIDRGQLSLTVNRTITATGEK